MNKLFDFKIEEVSAVDTPANAKKFLIIKREVNKGGDNMTLEEMLATIEDEELRKNLEAKYEELANVEVEIEDEELTKKFEEMESRIEKAETMAKIEREKRLKVEFEKTASKYADIAETEDIIKVLENVAPEEEVRDAFIKILDSALERADKEIEKEIGNEKGDEVDDIYTQLEKDANELAKAENISFEQAFVKILEENPDRYEEYQKEEV